MWFLYVLCMCLRVCFDNVVVVCACLVVKWCCVFVPRIFRFVFFVCAFVLLFVLSLGRVWLCALCELRFLCMCFMIIRFCSFAFSCLVAVVLVFGVVCFVCFFCVLRVCCWFCVL